MSHEDSSDPKRVDLSKLIGWYSAHCDGDWEHGSGVTIETLDNPGWILKVNLEGTNLEGAVMEAVSEGSEFDADHGETTPWINCHIKDKQFVGASDPTQLPRLISTFNALIGSVATSG